jgi:hypothetical protein
MQPRLTCPIEVEVDGLAHRSIMARFPWRKTGEQEVVVAKIVYGLNQALDGYVDHQALPVPSPKLFRHFIELAQQVTGSVYGRTMYGFMR